LKGYDLIVFNLSMLKIWNFYPKVDEFFHLKLVQIYLILVGFTLFETLKVLLLKCLFLFSLDVLERKGYVRS
jgi:hypothetical protein